MTKFKAEKPISAYETPPLLPGVMSRPLQPMLTYLLDKDQAQVINNLLQRFKIKIEEKEKYPGFKLILK